MDEGRSLAAEDLVKLAESAGQAPEPEIFARIRPHLARYFSERDYRSMETASARNWQVLIEEAAALLAVRADPASPQARALLDRWSALTRVYSGGDAQLEANSAQMFADLMKHPDPSRHPIPAPVWNFMQAIKAAKGK